MSEWMGVWMDGWLGEWLSGEWVNGWVNEWVSDWVNEWVSEWLDEWERVSDWVSGFVGRRVSDCVSEWVNRNQIFASREDVGHYLAPTLSTSSTLDRHERLSNINRSYLSIIRVSDAIHIYTRIVARGASLCSNSSLHLSQLDGIFYQRSGVTNYWDKLRSQHVV